MEPPEGPRPRELGSVPTQLPRPLPERLPSRSVFPEGVAPSMALPEGVAPSMAPIRPVAGEVRPFGNAPPSTVSTSWREMMRMRAAHSTRAVKSGV